MAWEEWYQVEPTGQKFTTGPHAVNFLLTHPDRCRMSEDEGGIPDVVIFDRPYKLRMIREVVMYWLEPMQMKDLIHWPPTFGGSYQPQERDPNLFEVKLEGGEVAGTNVKMYGSYDDRRLATDIPCGSELLARCAAETLESLRGRLVMEIGNEELVGVESWQGRIRNLAKRASRRRLALRRSAGNPGKKESGI